MAVSIYFLLILPVHSFAACFSWLPPLCLVHWSLHAADDIVVHFDVMLMSLSTIVLLMTYNGVYIISYSSYSHGYCASLRFFILFFKSSHLASTVSHKRLSHLTWVAALRSIRICLATFHVDCTRQKQCLEINICRCYTCDTCSSSQFILMMVGRRRYDHGHEDQGIPFHR